MRKRDLYLLTHQNTDKAIQNTDKAITIYLTNSASSSNSHNLSKIWHSRFGYISNEKLKQIIIYQNLFLHILSYVTIVHGKQSKLPFERSTISSTKCFKLSTQTYGENFQHPHMMDTHLFLLWLMITLGALVFFLKNKFDIYNIFKQFLVDVYTQHKYTTPRLFLLGLIMVLNFYLKFFIH